MNTDSYSWPRIRTLVGLMLVGSGVLLGGGMLVVWMFGDWRLTIFGPDYVPMAPSTAGLFVVLGLTALVLRGLRLGSRSHRVVLVTGVGATVLVAGSVLGEGIFGWSLPLVKWSAAAEAIRVGAIPVGRMSHLTALAFLLAGAGLTLASTRWRQTGPAACAAGLALGAGFLVGLFVNVGYLTGSPILYRGEVPMAFLTGLGLMGLALGLLLSGPLCPALLQWRRERANAPTMPAPDQFAQLLTAATAGIVLLISLFGFIYIRSQQTTTREQAYRHLDGIAALKAEQITQWRLERLGEANFLMGTPAVARDILAMIDSPHDAQNREAVRGWLENIKAGDRYEAVMVFDEQLNLVFSIPEMTRGEIVTPDGALRAALVSGTVREVDLHPSNEFNDALYNLLVPIRLPGGGAAAPAKALVSLRLNLAHYLFPKILSWPESNSSGESLIVRRDGDEVVFLSPLRRYAGPLFSLRYSIADLQLPAARAVRGEIGVFAGEDYHGVPVLSSSRRIPGSPWILIAKADQAEVYSPMRKTAALTGILVGLLVISILLAAGFFRRQRRLISMQRVLEEERVRNALASRITLLTRYANDIILLLDTGGKIIEANEKALLTYGYTLAELQGLPPGSLRAPESADNLETQFRKFATAEGGVIETQHRRKDGTTLFVQISGRTVPSANGDVLLVIRDVTERKRMEVDLVASLGEKNALLKEVHHRVKNNLQVITSLLRLEAGRTENPMTKTVLTEMQGRIRSMALLHETLYRTGDFGRIDLGKYLRQLATQLFRGQNATPERVQLELQLSSAEVDIDQAIPCGLIVNELLTNALKYAFPGDNSGRVRLAVAMAGPEHVRIQVSDTGIGLPESFAVDRVVSLGMQLVVDLSRQLQSKLEIGPAATFTLTFTPRKPVAGPTSNSGIPVS